MRRRIDFNDKWLFFDGEIEAPSPAVKGPAYAQAKTERFLAGPASFFYADSPDDYSGKTRAITLQKWERVTLPHDFIIRQTPCESQNNTWGFFDYHPAWYRKHFTVEPEMRGKRIVLYFEGVADLCSVYLNGCPMYEGRESHTPFEVDISDFVRFDGENVLAVHVETGKGEGWWYSGGGIYRPVWLEVTERLAVERYGVFVAPQKENGDRWSVPVSVEVRNSGFEDDTADVRVALRADDGSVVAEAQMTVGVASRSVTSEACTLFVDAPALWDVDDPVLYVAEVSVSSGGALLDRTKTSFGFRTLRFDANEGFFLNGRPLTVKGVCGHGDFGLTGRAVPESIDRYKARLIKEMGANAFRCSHYPHGEAWMDEMDRLGILVMAETRFFSSTEEGLAQLRTLVRRDRNHPSVFLWSVGNEEPYFIRDEGFRIARTLRHEVRKLDPTRPVLTANDRTPEECTVYGESDIVGINYNLHKYELLREKFPDKPFLSTENCATGTTRGWYDADAPALGRVCAYDHDTNNWFVGRERVWNFIMERPWVMGGFQWIAFEHRGEAVWPRVCSVSGAIDLFLQKKDAFWQNQSFWLDTPMIHVLPHWNFPHKVGKKVAVWAYTDCDEAELFLNGESLGRQTVTPYRHLAWDVVYQPGKLEAVGYRNGVIVATDRKETSGRPYALVLRAENAEDVRANGKDVLLLTCTCVDEQGRTVPDASPTVQFYTNGVGQVIGTGSDNTDHVPVTSSVRRMYAGAISVAVQTGASAGEMTVTALADGLIAAEIILEIK